MVQKGSTQDCHVIFEISEKEYGTMSAALQEMANINQGLVNRCLELATEVERLTKQVEEKDKEIEDLKPKKK